MPVKQHYNFWKDSLKKEIRKNLKGLKDLSVLSQSNYGGVAVEYVTNSENINAYIYVARREDKTKIGFGVVYPKAITYHENMITEILADEGLTALGIGEWLRKLRSAPN